MENSDLDLSLAYLFDVTGICILNLFWLGELEMMSTELKRL